MDDDNHCWYNGAPNSNFLNSSMSEFKFFIFDPSPAAKSPAGRGEMLHMHIADPSPGGSRFPGGFQKQINDKHCRGPCSGPAGDGRPGSSRHDGLAAGPARVTGWAALGAGTNATPGLEAGPDPGVFVTCLSVAPVHAAKESVP